MEAKRHPASSSLSRRRMAVVLRNSSVVSGSRGCRAPVEFPELARPGDRPNLTLLHHEHERVALVRLPLVRLLQEELGGHALPREHQNDAGDDVGDGAYQAAFGIPEPWSPQSVV